jgi:hypothetical protein
MESPVGFRLSKRGMIPDICLGQKDTHASSIWRQPQ